MPLKHLPGAAPRARMTIACLVASLVVAHKCAGLARAERDDSVLATFTIDGFNGIVMVPVTVRGVTYKFLVNTGAAISNVTPAASAMLAGAPRKARLARDDNTFDAAVYRLPEGRIGSLPFGPLDAVSRSEEMLNRSYPTKVAGTLGMDALKSFIVRVDYDAELVYFLRRVPRDAGVRIPLHECVPCPAIDVSVGASARTFTLATGCVLYGAGLLTHDSFDALAEQHLLSIVEALPLASRDHFAERRAGVLRVPFSVAGRQHSALAFTRLDNPEIPRGVLGAGYLRRYVVTFDFPHNVVYLARGRNFQQIDASHDPGGLRFRRDRERVVVSDVSWKCPASRAGVRVDEVLIEIDGRDAAALGAVGVACALSRSESPMSLVFRRQSDGSTVRFVHDERGVRQRSRRGTQRNATH